MDVIATVGRLQVQRSRLKPGERGRRVYDPSPLLEVDAVELGPRGVHGLTPGGRVVDVHHADHPDSRNHKGMNGLSLLPRAHYERMRARYGPRPADGAAGEVLLLDGGPLADADLAGDLAIEVDGGLLALEDLRVAAPCIEFSRWVLGREHQVHDTGPEVMAAMDDLDHGTRGFYLTARGTGVVRRGARLLRTG